VVLPIGNEHWEKVAEFHASQYGQNAHNVDYIWRKFYTMAKQQSGTGDPTKPPMVALAKRLCEAINKKAGVTGADVSDFFEDGDNPGNDLTDIQIEEEEEVPEQATTNNNIQTIVTTTEHHRTSVGISGNITTSIAPSVQTSYARTKQNQLVKAIESSSNTTCNAFEVLLQQRQLAEDLEWRQGRFDREEENNTSVRKRFMK